MGADFVITVNLNEDLLGRRLTELADAGAEGPLGDTSQQNILAMLKSMPTALRKQAESFRLFGTQGGTPGYFDVLANSINIMHDHITRSRLAGEPPHVQIAPRVAEIGLMDFHRAEAIIVEGRLAAELSIPIIKAMLMA